MADDIAPDRRHWSQILGGRLKENLPPWATLVEVMSCDNMQKLEVTIGVGKTPKTYWPLGTAFMIRAKAPYIGSLSAAELYQLADRVAASCRLDLVDRIVEI